MKTALNFKQLSVTDSQNLFSLYKASMTNLLTRKVIESFTRKILNCHRFCGILLTRFCLESLKATECNHHIAQCNANHQKLLLAALAAPVLRLSFPEDNISERKNWSSSLSAGMDKDHRFSYMLVHITNLYCSSHTHVQDRISKLVCENSPWSIFIE